MKIFIDSHLFQNLDQKIDENKQNINFIEEYHNLDILQTSDNYEFDNETIQSINKYKKLKNVKELMNILNNKSDKETVSFVFDKLCNESLELFKDLCKECISTQNPIAHHKYALSLIFNSEEHESKYFDS